MTVKIIIASVIALTVVLIFVKTGCLKRESNNYGPPADYIQGKTETDYVRGNTDTVKRAASYRHLRKLFNPVTASNGTYTFSDTIAGKSYEISYEVKSPQQPDSMEISFEIKNFELTIIRVDTIFVTRTDTLKFIDTDAEERLNNFTIGALVILSAGTLIYLLAN